ncbi:MAG: MATE family efflux transporter [Lachnospiraceae bacterium]|nr:MATE family efflux transporter [Lachnospiraceae bacterium]
MKTLTKGTPIKVILFFAIPLYIGQLFQLCYSLIDTHIIGSALGEASLAAVGATTSLSDMLIEFLNGIICGFGIIISTFFGANEEKKMRKAIGGTLFLGIVFTLLISVLCLVFLPQILGALHVSDELMAEAAAYIKIIIAGLIATTLYNICAAILRAIGDSFTPLLFLIISNVLNIFLDYFFVLNLGKGVVGAAAATVISQALSALLCFLYMRKKYPQIALHKEEVVPDKEVYGQLLPTGLSMGFMISFVTLGSLALQTGINTLGTNIIVAHTGARKATTIFLIPFFVLGTALATYCGQNLGAKEYARIKKGIKDTVLLSFGWCVIVLAVVFTLSAPIIHLITASAEPEVLDNASLYLKVNASFYFLPALICILRNSMQGFGDSRTPLISSLIELAGKVVIAWFLVPSIGYMGVIVSEPIVWAFMVIPLLISILRNPIFKRS